MNKINKSSLSEFKSDSINALIKEIAKNPENFKAGISEDDEMYLFSIDRNKDDINNALVAYFEIGRNIFDAAEQVIKWHFNGFSEVESFLDFACGYGRFTRFLIQEIHPSRIWASDVYRNAVRFQETYLGVNGFLSTGKPDEYQLNRKFDCILANSFFSHMPERTFSRWLENLYNLLSDDGVLMFTVHDESLLPEHIRMPASGILFGASSESQSLDMEEYGTTYVTEDFVREALGRVSRHRAFVHRIPGGIGGFQDLYIVTNKLRKVFSDLSFKHPPKGYVDLAAFNHKGDLYLDGWSLDNNDGGSIEKIEILINRKIVGTCNPSYNRPDVAHHFGVSSTLNLGWCCEIEKDLFSTNDVILIKVKNKFGRNSIIESCTISSLINSRFEQSQHSSTPAKLGIYPENRA